MAWVVTSPPNKGRAKTAGRSGWLDILAIRVADDGEATEFLIGGSKVAPHWVPIEEVEAAYVPRS